MNAAEPFPTCEGVSDVIVGAGSELGADNVKGREFEGVVVLETVIVAVPGNAVSAGEIAASS
jgi:hypothetical protein